MKSPAKINLTLDIIKKRKDKYHEIKSLVNFSGDYKSDMVVNECLCGNISQYKKIMSELYLNTTDQILLMRILSNKVKRLLKIKTQESKSNNLDNIISNDNTDIPCIDDINDINDNNNYDFSSETSQNVTVDELLGTLKNDS